VWASALPAWFPALADLCVKRACQVITANRLSDTSLCASVSKTFLTERAIFLKEPADIAPTAVIAHLWIPLPGKSAIPTVTETLNSAESRSDG
jgi:hypothetical protein